MPYPAGRASLRPPLRHNNTGSKQNFAFSIPIFLALPLLIPKILDNRNEAQLLRYSFKFVLTVLRLANACRSVVLKFHELKV